jgi:hypothetical protein
VPFRLNHYERMNLGLKILGCLLLPASALVVSAPIACSSSSTMEGDGGHPPDAPEASPPPDVGDVQEPDVHQGVSVLTSYNGNGTNIQETFLNAGNVNESKFGELFAMPVDGDLFAQPLYVSGLKMGDGKTHNVVFAATQHDSVYAFDADSAGAPLWHKSVGTSTPMPSPYLAWEWTVTSQSPGIKCGGSQQYNQWETGITSTPVIDPTTSTIYVVALNVDMTKTTPGGTCLDVTTCKTVTCDFPTVNYQLHALDLVTGAEKFGGPVDVQGTVPGTGEGSKSGMLTFEAGQELQRPSLLLANGNVYFATSSFNDSGIFHGWMFAYDKATLKQVGLLNDTPNGEYGGIWQSGHSPIADSDGNVYVITGQGTFTGNMDGGADWGDTFLKLSPDLSQVKDYFTQYLSDYQGNNFPDDWDDDFGSCGPATIPGTTMALLSGKLGYGYLVDMGHLGGLALNDTQIIQKVRLTWRSTTHACGAQESWVLDTPVAWQGPDGTHVFVWSVQDYLRDYLLDKNGKFNVGTSPCFCSPWVVGGSSGSIDLPGDPPCAIPNKQGTVAGVIFSAGGALTVSSNGTEAGTGVLWATYADPTSTFNGGDAAHYRQPGILAAYNAIDVSKPIWISTSNAARDSLGKWAKFSPPTVANGKVYVGTFSSKTAIPYDSQVVVYGLLDAK